MTLNEALHPSPQLLAILGSVVVHADEATSPGGHGFDYVAMRSLLADPNVQAWIEAMGPLLPMKRRPPGPPDSPLPPLPNVS